MLLKDYVEYLTYLLDNNPEYGELEVWTYSDEEGNSILPMYEGGDSAFVEKDVQEFKKVVNLEPELFSGVLVS